MTRVSVPRFRAFAILIPTQREFAAVAEGIQGGQAPPTAPWQPIRAAPNISLILSGIGKANACGAAAAGLGDAEALICMGVAGALPGRGAGLGDVVLATSCLFSDEGVQTDDGFLSCAQIGFPIGPAAGDIPVDGPLAAALDDLADRRGPIATVSTCAGTDALAQKRASAAIAEAMEGAAAGLAAWRLGRAFAELRVISNTTGRRSAQKWDLDGALRRLSDLAGRVADRLG